MSNEPEVTEEETGKGQRLEGLRAKLAGKQGKAFWSSFEELADTPEFQEWVQDEVPNRAELMLGVDRRKFLQIGASALAMMGLTGCRILPPSRAVPYVRSPEELVSGVKLVYATAVSRGGYATGILVESAEGRPIKVEGNPAHPGSLGSTLAWEQGELLNMYDPDRSQTVRTNTKPGDPLNVTEGASWDQAFNAIRTALIDRAANNGQGFALLTENITSPSLNAAIASLMKTYPQARWVQYEPINRDNVYEGTRLAFGRPLNPIYRLRGAKTIVTLDADFFTDMPGSLRYAREFSDGRRVRKSNPKMNRLYAIESAYTIVGATADHRLPVKPSEIETIARAIYAGVAGGNATAPASVPAAWLAALVKDLKANAGAAVVIPGEQTTPATQALCHAINGALSGIGNTVVYTEPVEGTPGAQARVLKALTDAMAAGNVKTLLILGGNPVYNAPADLDFAGQMGKVPLRVHLSRYDNETSALCDWHLPETHTFESWGDVRAYDGTVSIQQPLIAPLYDGKSVLEVVDGLLGSGRAGFDIVQSYWKTQYSGANFPNWWERAVQEGVVPATALPTVTATVKAGLETSLPTAPAVSGTELSLRPDPSLWDGRWANNAWLQELPKPITSIAWDNVAVISPATAKKMGVVPNENDNDARQFAQSNGKKVLDITVGSAKIAMPVWILPGQPEDVITTYLGFGRTRAGETGNGQGFDTYKIRTVGAMAFATGVTATVKAGAEYPIVSTQPHHTMRGIAEDKNRPIIETSSLSEYLEKNGEVIEHEHVPTSLVPTAYGRTELNTGEPAGGGEGHEPGHSPISPTHGFGGAFLGDAKVVGETPDQGKEVYADSLRKQWRYTERSASNKENWPTLYPEYSNRGFNAWAMSVDLTTCIGCNACTIACQAENNVPVVGKDQVGRSREMHWIRIDHYYATDEKWEDVESYFQPVMCQHCEKAPCEPVCPVAATIHSHEGLNQMVYNRCVGTRYCSNNCPYKVRRFNFLKWVQGAGGETTLNYYDKPQLHMLTNPDVTLRGRGVMEKCTYCVQRINAARIEAKKAGREIKDGEVITACQQVCPTNAIVFGDMNDPNSSVSKLRSEPHDYSLLSELNTRPRTTYMAKNPKLQPGD